MDFFQHTTNWLKGEMFEATLIGIFGVFVFLFGISFWKFGTVPTAKTLIIPLLVVGGIFISTGVSMYFANQKKITEYQQQFSENKTEFIQQEKKRVEGFQYLYTVSKIIATVSFLVAIIAFWFTKNTTFQGIAIGLLVLGISGLVIDYFSEERAKIYYQQIELFLK